MAAFDRLWELRSRTTATKRQLMADHGGHTSVLGYDEPSGANALRHRNQVPSFGFPAGSIGSNPRLENILSWSKGHGPRSRQSLVFHLCSIRALVLFHLGSKRVPQVLRTFPGPSYEMEQNGT